MKRLTATLSLGLCLLFSVPAFAGGMPTTNRPASHLQHAMAQPLSGSPVAQAEPAEDEQQTEPADREQQGEDEPSGTETITQYQQLKALFFRSAANIIHTMLGAPATKDTIELKDTLSEIAHLEMDYAAAREAGADPATLKQYATRYVELMDTVYARHQSLSDRVSQDVQRLVMVRDALVANFPNEVTADRTAYDDKIDELKERCKSLNLGLDRIQELLDQAQQGIAARQKADPHLQVTYQVVSEEIEAAALRVLDHRTSKPRD
jgi:hypothetical protein